MGFENLLDEAFCQMFSAQLMRQHPFFWAEGKPVDTEIDQWM